jgi:hypothetical protein
MLIGRLPVPLETDSPQQFTRRKSEYPLAIGQFMWHTLKR